LDIDGWLRGLGLAQYAEIFRANDIDGELLGRLVKNRSLPITSAPTPRCARLAKSGSKSPSVPAFRR